MERKKAEELQAFFASLRGAQNPLLLLDYDGTLADFQINRFDARPWDGVRELLTELQRDQRTHLIVITGRPPSEINPLLQLHSPVEIWGLHGAEHLHVDGRTELEPLTHDAAAKLDELRKQLRQDALGGLLEEKANAVVMHWRGLSAQRAEKVRQKTLALFCPAAEATGLSLLPFESGIELRAGRDKGGAVEAIAKNAEPGTPIAYLGDDLTDEAAFRVMNQLPNPHVSVLVRRKLRETAANFWLRPPEELRWFFCEWLKALDATAGDCGRSSAA